MSHSPVVKDLMLSPLLGIFGTMVLYGVTCMQTFQYYSNYPQDSIRMKAMVATIFVLGTIQTAFAANYVGYYLIDRYGDLDALARIQWTVPASAVIGFVITWAVNQFFVRRIYLLSKKNLWLAILIGILATLRPGFGLAACAMTVVHNDWATFTERARWIMVCGLSIGPVVDWLITLCLAYQLLKGWGPNTIAEPTRNIINTLLKYTVNTGVILSVFAVFELITLLTARKTLFFPWDLPSPDPALHQLFPRHPPCTATHARRNAHGHFVQEPQRLGTESAATGSRHPNQDGDVRRIRCRPESVAPGLE